MNVSPKSLTCVEPGEIEAEQASDGAVALITRTIEACGVPALVEDEVALRAVARVLPHSPQANAASRQPRTRGKASTLIAGRGGDASSAPLSIDFEREVDAA